MKHEETAESAGRENLDCNPGVTAVRMSNQDFRRKMCLIFRDESQQWDCEKVIYEENWVQTGT